MTVKKKEGVEFSYEKQSISKRIKEFEKKWFLNLFENYLKIIILNKYIINGKHKNEHVW